uniref:Poly [ADP-ribose] polymerase n=1 Tax=Strix occidentalis caurina TaxID=311401 RepID=A0A8D0FK76_STROC
MFFEKEKTSVWGDLENKGVKVDFSTQEKCRVISLSGPRSEVLKGVTLVEQILSGLHYKRMVIKEPGAKSYFKEREHFFAATAKQNFKCLVRLEEPSEQQEHSNTGKPYRQVTMDGIVIAVYKADLYIVVISVAKDLRLDKGPLSKALLSKAGPMLQTGLTGEGLGRTPEEGSVFKTEGYNLGCSVVLHAVVPAAILNGAGKEVEDECAQLASQSNKSYITTQAGSLPCKKIIHFVAQDDIKLLVSEVLQECELQQYTSVTFPAVGTVLPATWDDMQDQRLKIVELKPETKEYKDVQERFLKTCQSFKIEKIERIQNPFFWKAYKIKKREMDNKNGNTNNERLLFHGTSKESLTLINNHGFNRSYAGMHAANFGNGTYFAVDASYSAYDTYSRPDANGRKYMYLARVLVGEYSQGTKGSITPGAKNASNSIDLFDSSTDNMNKPSMFIIFNDIQAYPEYLITFTK